MRYLQNALTTEKSVTWVNKLIILDIYHLLGKYHITKMVYLVIVYDFRLMSSIVHCVSFLLYFKILFFNFDDADEPPRHNRADLTPGLRYPENDQTHAPLGSKLTRFQGVVN